MKRGISIFCLISLMFGQVAFGTAPVADANSCVDVRVVWANGSGAVIDGSDNNYNDFKTAIENELNGLVLSFGFYELGSEEHGGYRYPAASIGANSIEEALRTVAAYFTKGEGAMSDYAESVRQGVGELKAYIDDELEACPQTKFVLAGYSQGGQTVSTALLDIDPENIIYAATFGDPKLLLPEGKSLLGSTPLACVSEDYHSEYRVYVPDCEAYEGILGGRNPYRDGAYRGKVGAWCAFHDVVCSSWLNVFDIWEDSLKPHGSYGLSEEYFQYDLFSDAAIVIKNKIRELIPESTAVGAEKNVAILLDTTGSMRGMIDNYEAEAMRLAEAVWEQGGKVALFTYRDLADPMEAKMLCGFTGNPEEACEREKFETLFSWIKAKDGGDTEESALQAMYYAMNTLDWTNGAEKTMILLTDAGYHDPEEYRELELTTVMIINLSKSIDPVRIFTITPDHVREEYAELAHATGGKNYLVNEMDLMTDYVVDDISTIRTGTNGLISSTKRPEIQILGYETDREKGEIVVNFTTDADSVGVIINEELLGRTEKKGTDEKWTGKVTISGVDFSQENVIRLIPFVNVGYAGEAKEIVIATSDGAILRDAVEENILQTLPTAPNCGSFTDIKR